MIVMKPPMGWNTWNTFGLDISEELIFQTADEMVSGGYRDAGYEYLVIDDGWAEKERGEDGSLVPDRTKFPHGMKAVADYVHKKGLKFGIYSCAGVRTCAGYPASYDHEFEDAATFASWGVDFLKYDFCSFPENADCKNRYLRMSIALKASGRDILFSACNWGEQESWNWMRAVGADMYRSTSDIFDNFRLFPSIYMSQMEHFCQSSPGCFNDLDMLTVGMNSRGNAAIGKPCSFEEYTLQFVLWCMASAPLFIGADIRNLSAHIKSLLLNPALIAINQDAECRPPYVVSKKSALVKEENTENAVRLLREEKDKLFVFLKHLSGNTFALVFVNLFQEDEEMGCIFADAGLPVSARVGFSMTDILTGDSLGVQREYVSVSVKAHSCRVFKCTLVKV